MPANLIKKNVITTLAARAAGLDNRDGNRRVKQVVTPIHLAGLNQPFARIRFDFTLTKLVIAAPTTVVNREHAEAA